MIHWIEIIQNDVLAALLRAHDTVDCRKSIAW